MKLFLSVPGGKDFLKSERYDRSIAFFVRPDSFFRSLSARIISQVRRKYESC